MHANGREWLRTRPFVSLVLFAANKPIGSRVMGGAARSTARESETGLPPERDEGGRSRSDRERWMPFVPDQNVTVTSLEHADPPASHTLYV
jgi:hypothetical protein